MTAMLSRRFVRIGTRVRRRSLDGPRTPIMNFNDYGHNSTNIKTSATSSRPIVHIKPHDEDCCTNLCMLFLTFFICVRVFWDFLMAIKRYIIVQRVYVLILLFDLVVYR
jgi:hypothetical protein